MGKDPQLMKKRSRMRYVAKRDCDIGHSELRRYEIEHAIIVDVSKYKTFLGPIE